MEGSSCGLISPEIFQEGLRKITKYLSESSRSLGWDLNPEPPEYEDVPTTGLLRTGKRPDTT
jgi:hypothetical protein